MLPRADIVAQLSAAVTGVVRGTNWPSQSYEEGVAAALAWILGHTDTPPIEGVPVPSETNDAFEWGRANVDGFNAWG